MKFRLLLTGCLICSVLLSLAQPQQKVLADKIVAVVGDKIILKSDIDNSLADMMRQGVELPPNAKCLTLEQMMGVKALVLQAEKDSLPVSDEEVETDIENRIRYFINAYGSKDELERVAGKSVYQLKEDMRGPIKDQKMATTMRDKVVSGIKITPNEVKAYFDKIPADSLAERCGNGLQSLPQQHDFMDHTKDESQQQHGQWLWLVQELSCDWDRLPWQHGEEIVEP